MWCYTICSRKRFTTSLPDISSWRNSIKVYTIPVTCSVCGGQGLARPQDAGREWFGGGTVHKDPSVCRDNIRRKQAADAKKIQELEQQLAVTGTGQ